MSPSRSIALAVCLASMLACGSEVHLPTGGAGGTTTTSSTTTSSISTSSTTTSTTSAPACPSSCASDADCAACTAPLTGCCDLSTQICDPLSADVCPPPNHACTPGGDCAAGGICSVDDLVGPCTCTCDATSHYQCAPPPTTVPCPAVHPACGDPCDSSKSQSCMCTSGSETAPCACTNGAWLCSAPGSTCPPAVGGGMACTDFALGTMCSVWVCADWCGARMWINGTGI